MGPAGEICDTDWVAPIDKCYEDCVAPGLCDEAMDNLVPCVWCACEDSAAFAEAILDDIEANFCVNTYMEFATGESNGGLMTFEVGQKLAHRLAAIVPIEAAPHIGFNFAPEKGPSETHTISIMNIHGTRDTEIPALGAISVSGWWYSPVSEIMKVWAKYNECHGRESDYAVSVDGVRDLDCQRARGRCKFGTTDVVHCNWQGTHYTTTDSFSAQVSWEFFEMHPKPGMPHPVVGEGGRHHCNDGLDNDADGVADCDDPGCATLSFCRAAAAGPAEPACPATVTINGDPCFFPFTYSGMVYNACTADDAMDGVTPWCATRSDADGGWRRGNYASCDCLGSGASHPPPAPPPPPPPPPPPSPPPGGGGGGGRPDDPATESRRECRDNIDNDGDGAADCADPDCATMPTCRPAPGCDERTTRELLSDGSCSMLTTDLAAFCASSCHATLRAYSTQCGERPSITGREMLAQFSGMMSQCIPWQTGDGLAFTSDCQAESATLDCPVARAAYGATPKQIAGRCTQLATQAMSDIQNTCCDDAASCTSGAPTVCSASCAIVFLPYQAQCAATVWGNQPTFAASMSTFRETCLHG